MLSFGDMLKDLPSTPGNTHTLLPVDQDELSTFLAEQERALEAAPACSDEVLSEIVDGKTGKEGLARADHDVFAQGSVKARDRPYASVENLPRLQSVSTSPETPLARKTSPRAAKRSVEAAKAHQMLTSAVNSATPPRVIDRTSSLRRKPSSGSSKSVRAMPMRKNSYPLSASTSSLLDASTAAMVRTPSEPLIASIAMAQTPSTDSEARTSVSCSTRTSASVPGFFTGRTSTTSSSFTYETDCSSPYSPEEKLSQEAGDVSPGGVGLGISADYPISPTESDGSFRNSSRSRSSSAAYERAYSTSHRRFSSSISSSVAVVDKVVRCSPGADISDLFVPADTTHLFLQDASKGVEAFLLRTLPTLAPTLLVLDLSRTHLRALPPALRRCKGLQELLLNGNKFEGGMLPHLLPELTSLRKLSLDGCRLAHLTASLAPLKDLNMLSLRYNALRALPSWLCQMSGLTKLTVDGNPFTSHWASLVRPLLDPMLPMPGVSEASKTLSDSQGSANSSSSQMTSMKESPRGSSNRDFADGIDSFETIRPNANHIIIPQKMRSMGELRNLPSGSLRTLPNASASDLTSPTSLFEISPTSVIDTIPPSLPLNHSSVSLSPKRPNTASDGSLRKRGIFGAMRIPSRDGKRNETSDGLLDGDQNVVELGKAPSGRFLTSGFRRKRTASGVSAVSGSDNSPSSPTQPRDQVIIPSAVSQASFSASTSNSPASSLSSRPTTSMSIRQPIDATLTGDKASATDMDDREILDSEDHTFTPTPSIVDERAGMRMLMAYLRDLDDLTPFEKRSSRSGSRSADSRPASRASQQLATSRPVTPSQSLDSGVHPPHGSASRKEGSSPAYMGKSADLASVRLKEDFVKRERVVEEILTTEQTYVRGLEELAEIYVRPAMESGSDGPIVPVSERKAVFSNVEDILRFHASVFLPDLEAAVHPLRTARDAVFTASSNGQLESDLARQAARAVAEVFITHAAYLKMYAVYITAFDHALTRFQSWTVAQEASTKASSVSAAMSTTAASTGSNDTQPPLSQLTGGQRKKIKAYLKACRAHPKHSQMNCESYLLLPVQRIPRYKMLLESLISCTPLEENFATHLTPDPRLVYAFELVSALATELNERKRESEGRRKLLGWQSRIGATRFKSPLVQPHRVLLREGSMSLSRVVKRATAYTEGRPSSSPSNPLDSRPNLVQIPSLQIKSDTRPLIALLCSDILVLIHDSGAATGPVDLYTVFRPQHGRGAPASSFGVDGMLRIVDARAILYLKCANQEEAASWASLINSKLCQH